MKIGYFISHFPYIKHVNDVNYDKEYAHGGTEIAAYNLALNIAKKHDVEIFTTSIDSEDAVEHNDNLKIHRYATNLKISSANLSSKILYKPLSHEIDITHAHYNMPYSDYVALRYAKKKNVPFVVTYHADAQDSGGNFIRNLATFIYNRTLLKKVLKGADVIIATSNSFINESRFLGDFKEKIRVIPNGINIEEFEINLSKEECKAKLGLPLNKKIILFLGNIVSYKGPDILIKAFNEIKDEVEDVELVFAGRGEMQGELIKMANDLGIIDNIRFTGYVDEELKPIYFKSADIFCLPSITKAEAFGIVNLEAMACGVPIIASRLGGIPDIVKNEENGLLVNPNDSKSLADAILFLLKNEDIAQKMGNKGKRMVKDYSWEKIAEETDKIYKELYYG
ncbi:MAG: glycosyltransferase family 4 protein [Methanobacterium sp.]|uniref:glycosyltransferase family 4 protein n=1 Tax=Methanobacterium sp. TaxID=2164 RepID=UPI003D64EF85|nr:glycosyltransferase family 4 protein [Methanobacterium sp.]